MTENAPDGWTNQEWVSYTSTITNAWIIAILGFVLFTIGMLWGFSGAETMFVETEEGVTIVEGGASDGFLKGPAMGAVGLMVMIVGVERARYANKYRSENE